jgi:hypothetical protein
MCRPLWGAVVYKIGKGEEVVRTYPGEGSHHEIVARMMNSAGLGSGFAGERGEIGT